MAGRRVSGKVVEGNEARRVRVEHADVPRTRATSTVHPEYFQVRFRAPRHAEPWPRRFVILTGFATTGTSWTDQENTDADRCLEETLRARLGEEAWVRRITGFSPTTGHAESGWAAPLPFEEACDLGVGFLQDALYVVRGDRLLVSYCDERRALVPVGSFRERLEER